jgi:methylenetetrahydrofolate reductase (NADPH)
MKGWCEVYPQERYCIYYKAYLRLKRHGEVGLLDSYITPPCDGDIDSTSAWSNYTHGRDNAARRLYLPRANERGGAGGGLTYKNANVYDDDQTAKGACNGYEQ